MIMQEMSMPDGREIRKMLGNNVVDGRYYATVSSYLRSKFPRMSRDAIFEATHLGISEWYSNAPRHVCVCPKKSRGWITQVAQRSLSKELRRERRFGELPTYDNNTDGEKHMGMMDELCQDDARAIVGRLSAEKMFAALSPKIAETMRLHVIEEYTVDEVAARLGCSRDAVKKRLKAGYARLREVVRQDECDW